MKALFIAVSLLVNAALLVAFVVQPSRVPPAFRDYFSFGSGSASSSPSGTAHRPIGSGPAKPAPAGLWATLHSGDLASIVARLRAAGFPIYAIRAILQNEVSSRYDARMRELSQGDANAPFWKATTSLGMDEKRLAEYTQLANERSKLMRDLLGNFLWHDNGTLSTADARRYGSLPQAKIDQLERINADYSDLTSQVRAATNGITLPEDTEKLALLDREKRADLVALLTPEELADYDMRTSPVTARLRPAMALFNASEDEFHTIYQIEQAFNDRINPNLALMAPQDRTNFLQQRTAAQKEMDAQLQAALGDQRYAEFVRSSDRDYQQLTRLTEQQNLPPQVALQAYDLRNNLSQESNRIFDDTSLGYDQKRAALQSLAQNTRSQLAAALGPASDAYLKSATWLANVERGGAVTFNGNGTSFRSLPNANGTAGQIGSGMILGGGQAIISSGGGTFQIIGTTSGVIQTPVTAPSANTTIISNGTTSTIIQSPAAVPTK